MGPQGPAGPTGPQGPAGASSLDALIGTTCNIGSPDQGLLQVTYASDGSGSITLKCVPTTLHNLTVSVSGGDGFDTVTSSPAGIDCDNAMTTRTWSQPLPAGSTVTLTAQPDGGAGHPGAALAGAQQSRCHLPVRTAGSRRSDRHEVSGRRAVAGPSDRAGRPLAVHARRNHR